MMMRPVVVVLAAGKGSRFAGPTHKLGQALGDASVLDHALRTVLASHLPVVVVTTDAFAADVRRSVAARDIVVLPAVGTAADVPLGMGFSIAAGVSARPNASGWLVLPGDMPMIQPSTLLIVARALEHHAIAYAQHRGRRGHPVGFSSELYQELTELSGDAGARRLLARYPSQGIEVADPGVLVDIDTEDDLARARQEEDRLAKASQPGSLWNL